MPAKSSRRPNAEAEDGESPAASSLVGRVVGSRKKDDEGPADGDEDIRRTVVRADSLVKTVTMELNKTDGEETEEIDCFEGRGGTADETEDTELDSIVRTVVTELNKTGGEDTEDSSGGRGGTADETEDTQLYETDSEGRGGTADETEDTQFNETDSEDAEWNSLYSDESADGSNKGQNEGVEIPLTASLDRCFASSKGGKGLGGDSLDGNSPREIRGGGTSRSSTSSQNSSPKIRIPLYELALPGLFPPGRDVSCKDPQQDVPAETEKTVNGGDDNDEQPMHDHSNGPHDVGGVPEAPPPNDGEDGQHHHVEEEEPLTEADIIRQKLSLRAYHLPGNNWCQDLDMYIRNNHLIFGLFCHHELHPVKWYHRLVLLLGSFAFGLIITNIVYLHGDAIENTIEQALLEESVVAQLGEKILNETDRFVVDEFRIAGHTFEVNTSKLGFLFTIGSCLHSMFDYSLWHLIACGYCGHTKQRELLGWFTACAVVMIVVCITTTVIVFTASDPSETYQSFMIEFVDDEDIGSSNSTDTGESIELSYTFMDETFGVSFKPLEVEYNPDSLQFLYAYFVELLLSLFLYSPMIQVIFFSGVLGCGRLPVFGGRPRSMRLEKRQKQAKTGTRQADVTRPRLNFDVRRFLKIGSRK
mmetsp:Transcript_11320/g.26478  ORF Transcript_11320/g.26478 Transcript_11320/m.26478 type:complete len:644 (+) Transcript_11320:63-1994(+)